MMTRPTRYCECGEYVTQRSVTHPGTGRSVTRLVHISETGAVIDRAHNATEEMGR